MSEKHEFVHWPEMSPDFCYYEAVTGLSGVEAWCGLPASDPIHSAPPSKSEPAPTLPDEEHAHMLLGEPCPHPDGPEGMNECPNCILDIFQRLRDYRLAAAQQRIVDLEELHLADEQSVRNMQRVIDSIRTTNTELRKLLKEAQEWVGHEDLWDRIASALASSEGGEQ